MELLAWTLFTIHTISGACMIEVHFGPQVYVDWVRLAYVCLVTQKGYRDRCQMHWKYIWLLNREVLVITGVGVTAHFWKWLIVEITSKGYITHWGQVTHIWVSKLTFISADNGLSPGRRQAINLKQCWNIVYWTLRNKFQWNFNRNSKIFIQENAFESAVCKIYGNFASASMC